MDEQERAWRQLADEAFAHLTQWRQEHPTATFAEIEAATDTHLAAMRARMLRDVALASAAVGTPATCPACGARMQARGKETRTLVTITTKRLRSRAPAPFAPPVVRGFSPLDEELALLPGPLTPGLQETLVRLGTVVPFGRAARLFTHCTHTTVSESTARRLTERAGTTYAAVQDAEAVALTRHVPECRDAPRCQLLSADGAMVPLRGGVWGEVKLLAIGAVGEAAGRERMGRAYGSIELLLPHDRCPDLRRARPRRNTPARDGAGGGGLCGDGWRGVAARIGRSAPPGCGAHSRFRARGGVRDAGGTGGVGADTVGCRHGAPPSCMIEVGDAARVVAAIQALLTRTAPPRRGRWWRRVSAI